MVQSPWDPSEFGLPDCPSDTCTDSPKIHPQIRVRNQRKYGSLTYCGSPSTRTRIVVYKGGIVDDELRILTIALSCRRRPPRADTPIPTVTSGDGNMPTTILIRVEGVDPADSSAGAASLREALLNRAAEQNLSGFDVRTARSDRNAQDVSGDVVQIVHTAVITGLFIVETIKLWRELHRDKALIIEAKHGSAVRVELANPQADEIIAQSIGQKEAAS